MLTISMCVYLFLSPYRVFFCFRFYATQSVFLGKLIISLGCFSSCNICSPRPWCRLQAHLSSALLNNTMSSDGFFLRLFIPHHLHVAQQRFLPVLRSQHPPQPLTQQPHILNLCCYDCSVESGPHCWPN